MKKIVSMILVLAMCLSLCACGGSKKAFNASKEAYENIDIAYEITDKMSHDIYEAWRLGIYEDDEILDDGVEYLAKELKLSEDELIDGVAYTIAEMIYDEDWDSLTDDEKDEYRSMNTYVFDVFEDKLFSFCLWIVSNAYVVNGDVATAQAALDTAKEQMKNLSEKYSDYEHYPNLKGFYTTTKAFFDYCQDPQGSFEQCKTTINDYRNTARGYISDLDYIFEE